MSTVDLPLRLGPHVVMLERPLRGRLRLWGMPYDGGTNRWWLKDQLGDRIRSTWFSGRPGHWEIARDHLRPLLEALVDRLGAVEVLLDFSLTQKCDKRCRDATGDECVCSCLGVNHGGMWRAAWFEVGETTLISSELRRVRGIVTRETLRR